MEFKEWLVNFRKDKGLTQRELAKQVGISYVSLCHYERGDRTPNLHNINKLNVFTGVSVAKIRKMIKEGK